MFLDLISLRKEGYLGGIQLSMWDHTFGPMTPTVWEACMETTKEIRRSLSIMTLQSYYRNEEFVPIHKRIKIFNQMDDSSIITTFHILSSFNLIVIGTLFSCKFNRKQTKFSLAVILSKEYLEKYLPIHSYIETQLIRVTQAFTILLETTSNISEAGEYLCPNLWYFQRYLDLHMSCGIGQPRLPMTIFYSSFGSQIEFLSLIITSHFQTFGSTIIMGNDPEEVNYFLETLSFFLRKKERRLSLKLINNPDNVQSTVLDFVDFEELKKSITKTQRKRRKNVLNTIKNEQEYKNVMGGGNGKRTETETEKVKRNKNEKENEKGKEKEREREKRTETEKENIKKNDNINNNKNKSKKETETETETEKEKEKEKENIKKNDNINKNKSKKETETETEKEKEKENEKENENIKKNDNINNNKNINKSKEKQKGKRERKRKKKMKMKGKGKWTI
ncbi:hypothetical protein M0813_19068 [Anaeramoeba flamelloides]|uniref:Uncharacterized protein n=1 Tax=Anaeramoeba flamelloides TaxID=1746091 RepID=A0ABQ8YQZ3_9EUKA|nr:hypothetical protein M0813_19068 [Anaeramoeba flamelloides]